MFICLRCSILSYIQFEVGNLAMVTGGYSHGRIGVITMRERHPGGYDIVHLKDSAGNVFLTRIGNVFVLGHGNKPMIGLPRGGGVRLTIQQEKDKREKAAERAAESA